MIVYFAMKPILFDFWLVGQNYRRSSYNTKNKQSWDECFRTCAVVISFYCKFQCDCNNYVWVFFVNLLEHVLKVATNRLISSSSQCSFQCYCQFIWFGYRWTAKLLDLERWSFVTNDLIEIRNIRSCRAEKNTSQAYALLCPSRNIAAPKFLM